ncbi:MAG: response regulator transcription factor [Thermomicrobiales bacterium]|nr:response regulator transcription factor [Thermomicrobiales bacterium]
MNIHPQAAVLRKIASRRLRQQREGAPITWLHVLPHDISSTHVANIAPARGNGVLTRREVEVLRLVARGWTDRDIAERLYLSRRTVSNHVSNILGKLDVPSRRAAVVTAVRLGML